MNGKKARMLRQEIYGDYSLRERKLKKNRKTGEVLNDPQSLRAKYRVLKKNYRTNPEARKEINAIMRKTNEKNPDRTA